MWMELIKLLGGFSVIVLGVAWLIRSIVIHFLDKDIEAFKVNLQKEALEHEVRFRRVDEKVAEQIAELYRRLYRLFEVVHSYVKNMERNEPTKAIKFEMVVKANRELNDILFLERVYFPPRIFERTRDLSRKLRDIALDFKDGLEREKEDLPPKERSNWLEGMEAIEEEVNPFFVELVAAFQKRLGVEDDDESSGT